MDVFYEESSIAQNSNKGAKRYAVLNVFFWISVLVGIVMLVGFVFFIPNVPSMIFFGLQTATCAGMAFIFYRWKSRTNVSYDYTFVSGELRISRVINVNKRKLVTRFEVADMLQIGDVDSPSYDRFKADPSTKTVLCTSNEEAQEGKFFMYILIGDNGKKLYVLECREELLMQIMKFCKRTTLDRDYVSQEKKALMNK